MLTKIELANILSDIGASNANMGLDVHVVTQRQDNFLDLLRQLARWAEDQGLNYTSSTGCC